MNFCFSQKIREIAEVDKYKYKHNFFLKSVICEYPPTIYQLSNLPILKVAHEEQRDPGDAFKRAAIGFYLAHHLKLAGFFPPDYMTEASVSDSESSKDGFFSVKNQTVVTIVTLLVRHLQSCSCNAYEIDELVRDPNFMSANRNER